MKKLVAVLLIFCMLVLQLGCAPAIKVSMERAQRMNSKKYSVVVHTPEHKYNLYAYRFAEDVLSGELARYSRPKKKAFHVYTKESFDLYSSNNSSQPISLERLKIEKITVINHFQRNPLLYAGIIGLLIIGIATDEGGGYFRDQW